MAGLGQDVVRKAGGPLPADVAREAAAAALGAHKATWLPQYPWWAAGGLVLTGGPAVGAIAVVVGAGSRAPFGLLALELAGAVLFSAVFAGLVWKLVDPRWRRRRVYGFAGGLVRRDKWGWLYVVRWDEIAGYGRVPLPDGSPGKGYEIRIHDDRTWRLFDDDFRPGHVQALDEFIRAHRMTLRVRRPSDAAVRREGDAVRVRRPSDAVARREGDAVARRARLAAEAERLPVWARRV